MLKSIRLYLLFFIKLPYLFKYKLFKGVLFRRKFMSHVSEYISVALLKLKLLMTNDDLIV